MSTGDLQDLNFAGVRSLTQMLDRTPQGKEVANLLSRLGAWSTESHNLVAQRKPFPPRISSLSEDQLSDEHSYWTSELGRVSELVGLLNGQKTILEMRVKRARAQARQRYRSQAGEDVRLTATQVNDAAEEDASVLDAEETLAFVAVLLASLAAVKESTLAYINTCSREITVRGDQMKARLRG